LEVQGSRKALLVLAREYLAHEQEALAIAESAGYAVTKVIRRVNNAIWSFKKQRGIRLSEPLKGRVYITIGRLSPYLKDLGSLHKVEFVVTDRMPEGAQVIEDGLYLVSET